MGLNCGIVGLPNVGKSTIFNALTRAGAEVANYPFCTINPNVGVVEVPDERLDTLARMMQPSKVTPTNMQFVDIAGLVKGASTGEGLGNQFLGHIREVNAIAHVVRCFDDPDVVVSNSTTLDPGQDIDIIHTELILSDLQNLEKRLYKQQKAAKSGDEKERQTLTTCSKIKIGLEKGIPARQLSLSAEETVILNELQLMTGKPVLYVLNVGEDPSPKEQQHIQTVTELAQKEKAGVVRINGKLEAELNELEPEERKAFLAELGLQTSGLENLIQASYSLLNLITFFTGAARCELRAWTIKQGTKFPQAAGTIHTDFERGFIRGEVIHYEDYVKVGSEAAARDKGMLHVEGKEYVVQDGDIVHIRFNV
ncbi:MAG: redox-regulated ATPase YchF [Candidatus Schekmanbacteria bacterium]|nr:redox-regulated ATPase YchF [Candidatus Schekmanbacteria bacterium]